MAPIAGPQLAVHVAITDDFLETLGELERLIYNSACTFQLHGVLVAEQTELRGVFLGKEHSVAHLHEGRRALEYLHNRLLSHLLVSPGHVQPVIVVVDPIGLTIICHVSHNRLVVVNAAASDLGHSTQDAHVRRLSLGHGHLTIAIHRSLLDLCKSYGDFLLLFLINVRELLLFQHVAIEAHRLLLLVKWI